MSVFLNRERELSLLGQRFKGGKAEFIVVYGRRRVGKTELMDHFIRECGSGIRLLAREESEALQLKGFAARLGDFFNDGFLKKNPFASWDAFFEYLANRADKRAVVAIDEFPYLTKENRSLPSILQQYWDEKLRRTRIFLIISGSSISMMENAVLGYGSPLYGRRTGQLLVRPFSFATVLGYLKDFKKAVEFYSSFGGTPAYLMEADMKKDIWGNIADKILREDSFIYKDVEFVLRQELVEPRYYFSILLSISKGNHRAGLIANDTGLSKSIINKYLSVLADLQLVRRRVPVTESIKGKKGLWFLSDNLFDFWFRFVSPWIDEIEKGRAHAVLERRIKPFFNEYVGRHFEDVAREALEQMNERAMLPVRFSKMGSWWHKGNEIDAVALDDSTRTILFVECKWQEKADAAGIVAELREKARHVQWHNGQRKEFYAVIAKSFRQRITGPDVLLFDLKDLARAFAKS